MRFRTRMAGVVAAASLVLGVLAATAPSASATIVSQPPPDATGQDADGYYGSTMQVIDYDENGNPITCSNGSLFSCGVSNTINYSDSGYGGSSSASGCRKVTVTTWYKDFALVTAFHFNVWEYWCWNRANHNIYNENHGYSISNVNSAWAWQGIVNRENWFYQWESGYGHSGYHHLLQGHFSRDNGPLPGATHKYPQGQINAHSNGTWWWQSSV